MSSTDDAKQILAKCLFVSPDSIGDDDTITDIKAIDSLTFETLVLETEKAIGRDLEPSEMLTLETVTDLATLLSAEKT